ncbi:2-oxoacid:acceptor oxidoreductase subunit alpha [Rhodopila sp.]|uniref:2-oxoacid:acceptor oxidoreductase subunit alpha n=1 Tax=Rhodopila sp. TaxID=2480087 RepID=UPI003D09FD19
MLQQLDRQKGLQRVNDFVVKFANVNGSGSASANALFARSVLRMGIAATPRNIFPSNIQGLPTWYEVRISDAGHLAARGGGPDLMVAMNPQTWDQDVRSIEAGGYLFFDNTKQMPAAKFRSDVVVVGVPLTEITNKAYSDPRQRQLFKNIVSLGALSALIELDPVVIEQLLDEQFRGREKLIAANVEALHLGRDWLQRNLTWPIGLTLRPSDTVGDRIFIDGNSAAALGAVYGGATVCAWYPITPSTSLAEAFARYCGRMRIDKAGKKSFAIVQAEDELASIGMVIGAAWNGARAFTATSGPGISLMQEFVGLAYFAEIPAVIFDVQRAGPSTGMPTRTQQTDITACAYASHGDTKHVLLIPEDPHECFEFAALAFDLADRLQTPIFVMLDLEIGMNERLTKPFQWDDRRRMDRGKVMSAEALEAGKLFGRYLDVDDDGIAYRTLPGTHPTRGAFFTRGTSKDRMARYSEEGADYRENMERLLKKHATARRLVPPAIERKADEPTRLGAVYYGSTSPAIAEADLLLAGQGIHLDLLRVRGFPFGDEVTAFIDLHDRVYVVEQNRDGQLRSLLVNELEIDPKKLTKVLHYDGTPISARFIATAIADLVQEAVS